MKLSKNFTLEEMTHSRMAVKHHINNEPNKENIENLVNLVENVLQPLRDRILKPIVITSGFRSVVLNKLVGGAYKSQHTLGEAADFYVINMNLKDVYKIIVEEFDFDQVIYEFGWIHVSYRKGNNRKEALVAYKDNAGDIRYKKYNNEPLKDYIY